MARKLKSIFLAGPEGRLESILEEPDSNRKITKAVVLCHPHPKFGGNMHNKVVYRMVRAARAEGAAVLRFNFRGVGSSSGVYDGGVGERDDLRAAILYMRDRYSGIPLVTGGFSFGAWVSLCVACRDPRIANVIAVGTPVNNRDWSVLPTCSCPKHFVHSTRDQFGSRENMDRVFADCAEPKEISWISAADHFFSDALDSLEETVRRILK